MIGVKFSSSILPTIAASFLRPLPPARGVSREPVAASPCQLPPYTEFEPGRAGNGE